MGFWIFLAIIVALVVWAIAIYNGLVALRNRFKNAFAQIDVQLKRRYDLIPNLVETAKGYIKHERETLEAVIKARNRRVRRGAGGRREPRRRRRRCRASAQAEGALTGALGRLFALAEAYPDLKANQNMLQLQEELTSTENKIAFARQAYNDSVMDYNTKRESFPDNIIAGMFGFGPAELLAGHRVGRGAQGAEGFVLACPAPGLNFFEHQQRARRNSRVLVVLFLLAVVGGRGRRRPGARGASTLWSVDCVAARLSRAAPALVPHALRLGRGRHGGGDLRGQRWSTSPQLGSGGAAVADDGRRAPRRVRHRATRSSGACSTWSRRWRSPRACPCRRSTSWTSEARHQRLRRRLRRRPTRSSR